MKKEKRKPDDEAQSQRFVETARQLGSDEDGKAFIQTLNVIAPNRQKKETRSPNAS